MEEEKWLPVVGYEGLYEVSDFGRVRSLDRVISRQANRRTEAFGMLIRGKLRKPKPTDGGYLAMILCKPGCRPFGTGVHRLVARAFLGEPGDPNMEVNHKDFNKHNNHVDNLEWTTKQQNTDHAWDGGHLHPILGHKRGSKYTLEQVSAVRAMFAEQKYSSMEISNATGVSVYSVRRITSNNSWVIPGTVSTPRKTSAFVDSRRAKKLTRESVSRIREMCLTGEHSQAVMGRLFGVNQTIISQIHRGLIWRTTT